MRNEIRAVYSSDTIRVYQAYGNDIAEEVALKGIFGEKFKMTRMSWIKPSFLWMMYRCGWATKQNQENVLAIDIKRSSFDYIVKNAVLSTYYPESGMSRDIWKQLVGKSDIRCQWDPERDIFGNPLDCRSIQLGLRGQALYDYVNDWIVHIEDITQYVDDLRIKKEMGIDISAFIPQEKIYVVN